MVCEEIWSSQGLLKEAPSHSEVHHGRALNLDLSYGIIIGTHQPISGRVIEGMFSQAIMGSSKILETS
jgi:hypothetical protein